MTGTEQQAQVEALAGVYALVDATGALADGGRSLLRLSPAAADAPPGYDWSVFPNGRDAGAGDLGVWTVDGGRVEFRSRLGNGRYAAAPRREPAAGAEPVLDLPTLRADGGTYRFRRVRTAGYPAAFLSVALVDAAGALVAGGSAALTAPDGITTDAGFSGFQPFVTGGPAGEWTVAVTPAAGYALAPGQANPVRVVVAAGVSPTELRIRLVRAGGP